MTHSAFTRSSVSRWAALLALLAASVITAHCRGSDQVYVYRVGSGGGNLLVNTGNPVFLNPYIVSGIAVTPGTPIALPTTASGNSHQLIADGVEPTEGFLTYDPVHGFLVLTGYAANLGGTVSLPTTTATSVPRVVGRVSVPLILIDTTTALTDFSSGNSPRSAVTPDGPDLWAAGAAGLSIPAVRYAPLASTTSTGVSVSTFSDARQVNIFNSQLYVSSNDATNGFLGVGTVGSGLPQTSGQAVTLLPGLDNAHCAGSFAFLFVNLNSGNSYNGYDTVYIADDSTTSGYGGIQKWSWNGETWTYNGVMGSGTDTYRGLAGYANSTTTPWSTVLYATRKGGTTSSGGGELVKVVDLTGPGGNPAAQTPTLLVRAPTDMAFRGVVCWPCGTVSPSNSSMSISGTLAVLNTSTGVHSATITVTLVDNYFNPVSGIAVLLAGSPDTSTITPLTAITDTSGRATFTVTSAVANTVTYTALDMTDRIALNQKLQVSFMAPQGPPSATTSGVVATPVSVPADGKTAATITVTLKNANGTAVSGAAVSLAGNPTTSVISSLNGSTDANGTAVFTVVSSLVGTVTYTATDTTDGVIIGQTAQVTFTPPGPPGTQIQVAITLTIPGSVSLAWGAGTADSWSTRTAGDVTPLNWVLEDVLADDQVGLGEILVSNDACNNVTMMLHNGSISGTNAQVSAGIQANGGWSIGSAAGPDTFAVQAALGYNPMVTLSSGPQTLTANTTLAGNADQGLVLTVYTPSSVTSSTYLGLPRPIFVVMTAAPE